MAAIFFDIDGTLWDLKHIVPDSTKQAIKELKAKGHKLFVNSGRTKVFAEEPEIVALGFDGWITGCSTNISYHGQELVNVELDQDTLDWSIDIFYEYDMPVILEGRDFLYMDEDVICRDAYGNRVFHELVDTGMVKAIRGNNKNIVCSKASVVFDQAPVEEVIARLSPRYEIMNHENYVMEISPTGYTKASGIQMLCDKLGIPMEETYAFGDSSNDIEMLDQVAVGIVMGNGKDAAKAHADYITDSIHEDGIYNACKHFGLI